MGEAGMSNEFPLDSTDQLPDELPADFSDFDDETPEVLPASFAAFDEDYSSGPSTTDAPPPSMAQSSATPAAALGSPQLPEQFPPEKRERIMAFAQASGPAVIHSVPKGTPDPVFWRDAVHDSDTWRRQRDDRILFRGQEGGVLKSIYQQEQEKRDEEKREQERRKEWLRRQRQIAHGWAKYVYWLERSPQDAQAYRQQHEDELGEWLVEIAVSSRLKVRPKTSTSVKLKPNSRDSPRMRGIGS
jgi:hypothetical protein